MNQNNMDYNFKIADLLKNVSGAMLPEPVLFRARKSYQVEATIHSTQNTFVISTEFLPNCAEELRGLRVSYDVDDVKITNIRHEIVSSMCTGDTDVPFRDIDPSYTIFEEQAFHRLTPDYFEETSRRLGELTTSGSSEEKSLKNAYKNKYNKYSPFLAQCQVSEYYIFVVCPIGVYTNYPIGQWYVDILAGRCKLGMSIESKLVTVIGRDIFRDKDANEKHVLLELIFSSLNKDYDFNDYDYNTKEIMEIALGDLTDVEMESAIRIMQQCYEDTKTLKRTDPSAVDDYVSTIEQNVQGTRSKEDDKRVTVFPFVYSKKDHKMEVEPIRSQPFVETDAPEGLAAVWRQAFEKNATEPVDLNETEEDKIKHALDAHSYNKHRNKRWHKFKTELSKTELEDNARSGLLAKEMRKNTMDLLEKEKHDHKSFHPHTSVNDIQEFILGPQLTHMDEERSKKDDETLSYFDKLMMEAKFSAHMRESNEERLTSTEVFLAFVRNSEIVQFADLLSCIVEEVAYAKKHFNKSDEFMYRYLRSYKVGLVIHTAGEHVFFSCIYDKSVSTVIDTGRLGPNLYNFGDFIISDWSSLNSSSLEHFLKAGPYMSAILCHLMSTFGVDPFNTTYDQFFSHETQSQLWQCSKNILLIFLNNKLDVEETVTALRYFYMSQLDEFEHDTYKFVNRLPSCLRSRLTCYYVQKIFGLMNRYSKTPIKKIFNKDRRDTKPQEYVGIRSVFYNGEVTMEMLVDSFYYGYVVSKNRQSGMHNTFAITKKLIGEELKYLKNVERGIHVFGEYSIPVGHRTHKNLFKLFLKYYRNHFLYMLGDSWKETTKRLIFDKMAKTSFSDLATLKVSAKEHRDLAAEVKEGDDYPSLLKKLRNSNPEAFKSRPRAIEKVAELGDRYETEHGKQLSHIAELLPDCLSRLEKKGYFDSDIFSKSQHGGHREIHVLEIDARVVQYFLETISKSLCSFVQSETITHPNYKNRFVQEHYKDAVLSYGDFITLCKSADAKTWCQNHFVSRFTALLVGMTHPVFHGFIVRALRLWTKKHVTLPVNLIAMFLSNENTASDDPVFKEMRDRMHSGTLPFLKPGGTDIVVSSGMFQGILHYTSSFLHSMLQEVWRALVIKIVRSLFGKEVLITIVEGSDDSGALLTVEVRRDTKEEKPMLTLLYRMSVFKENMSAFMGVINSPEKSLLGALDLIEFNSEWYIRSKSVKPTFRWVSACLETNVVENFVSRYRIFSNTLTQTLEGGASTFECALIQHSQAWLHYKLLGLDSSPVFKELTNKWLIYPSPATGFFPLDPDVSAGLTGFDLSVYALALSTSYGSALVDLVDLAEMPQFEFEGQRLNMISAESKAIRLAFEKDSKWKEIVRRMDIPSYDAIVEFAEKYPEVCFGAKNSWEDDRYNIALKMFSPGVKSSLALHTSTLRMQIASAYLTNTPCFSVQGETVKFSLLGVLDMRIKKSSSKRVAKETLKLVFPNWQQFDEILDFNDKMLTDTFMQNVDYSKKNKATIEVYSSPINDEYPLLSICKQKWFNRKVLGVGDGLFKYIWIEARSKYPFIRDTLDETKEVTNMNTLSLKFFLETVMVKTRKITLYDSQAKHASFKSSITRIMWPGYKLRNKDIRSQDVNVDSIRHTLFCICSYFFRNESKTELVKRTLLSSGVLADKLSFSDNRTANLSIIRLVAEGKTSKSSILEEIKKRKRAVVGFFSERQRYIQEKKSYGGPGRWIGKIGSTSIQIDMEDDKCIRIIVSSITDIDNLGHSLNNLIKEIHLAYPSDTLSASNLYLKVGGRLSVAADHVPENSIPVLLLKDLNIDVFDKIISLPWEIKCDKFAIRLVLKPSSRGSSITILSETISARDWNSSLEILPGIDDDDSTGLRSFAASRTWHVENWDGFVKSWLPLDVRDFQRVINDKKLDKHLDREQFMNMLIRFMENRSGRTKQETHMAVKKAEAIMRERNDIMSMDTSVLRSSLLGRGVTEDTFNLISKKFDGTVDNETYDEDAAFRDSLKYLSDLLDSDITRLEYQELNEYAIVSMPTFNTFFDDLLRFLKTSSKMRGEEVNVESLIEDESLEFMLPYGKLFSWIFSRDMLPSDDESKAVMKSQETMKWLQRDGSNPDSEYQHLVERRDHFLNMMNSSDTEAANQAKNALKLVNQTISRVNVFKEGMMWIPDELEKIKMIDFVYALAGSLYQDSKFEFSEDYSYVIPDYEDELAHKTVLLGLARKCYMAFLSHQLNENQITEDQFEDYKLHLYQKFVNQDFLEIMSSFHNLYYKIEYRDEVLYKGLPTFPLEGDELSDDIFVYSSDLYTGMLHYHHDRPQFDAE